MTFAHVQIEKGYEQLKKKKKPKPPLFKVLGAHDVHLGCMHCCAIGCVLTILWTVLVCFSILCNVLRGGGFIPYSINPIEPIQHESPDRPVGD